MVQFSGSTSQSRFEGFDDKIISMYFRGMTVREIQGHLKEMYQGDAWTDWEWFYEGWCYTLWLRAIAPRIGSSSPLATIIFVGFWAGRTPHPPAKFNSTVVAVLLRRRGGLVN